MSKERELLKKSLSWMVDLSDIYASERSSDDRIKSMLKEQINNIRDLLAQPEQEPVAWMYYYDINKSYTIFQQYPQGIIDRGGVVEPLYTAPKI